MQIKVHTDSDFAAEKKRKSVSGYVIYLDDAALAFKT